jgi:hypothetical protein
MYHNDYTVLYENLNDFNSLLYVASLADDAVVVGVGYTNKKLNVWIP